MNAANKHTKKKREKMEIEINFTNGYWVRADVPMIDWPIFRNELDNWPAVSYLSIREAGATVWTVLEKELAE
jgi:hypothetical protein